MYTGTDADVPVVGGGLAIDGHRMLTPGWCVCDWLCGVGGERWAIRSVDGGGNLYGRLFGHVVQVFPCIRWGHIGYIVDLG